MSRRFLVRLPLWAVVSISLVTLFVPLLRAELNLTPHREEIVLDGVKMWELSFENGTKRKAFYNPPLGWSYAGTTNCLELQPKGKPQSRVTVVQEALEESVSFDEEDRKKLSDEALRALPQGSEQTRVEIQAPGPLQINGKETCLVELSYTYYGESFSRYCLLLDANGKRIRFELTCRTDDYQELSVAFQRSLYSWRNL